MSSAWLLPEHIADVLPAQARQVETLRRGLLDAAESFGYELVIPPMLEHIESLLSGTGHALDLQTFKLVDQLSGRTLGIRADSTPQVARIDAHLLNRRGVARLCYCGPVLHTRTVSGGASREPLQFGAEIYGHPGLEADLEVLDLALECLRVAGLERVVLDLADARIVRAVLAGVPVHGSRLEAVHAALASKDVAELRTASRGFPAPARDGLEALVRLYGTESVLVEARRVLPERAAISVALDQLAALAAHARQAHPDLSVGFDLADSSGYAYYSGLRFAAYSKGASREVARGGRYDEVGAIFGRVRPAVGFGLDVKELAMLAPAASARSAIHAPDVADATLRAKVRQLRSAGEIVVCELPGDAGNESAMVFDRSLVQDSGRWTVQ
ncbi:MAG: ATP phosphoribosyltransferase regulatory subunit [Pseudomonadota bacterium]|nr:ATP phosphoribosyltransferase regulatory subunit [Pseudomonadota bacterium]